MTVYVDDMLRRARVGRLTGRWSHLMADTHEELESMARELSLSPSWIQHPGTYREHYDITEPKRLQAIGFGAVPIAYPSGTGRVLAAKRASRSVDPRNRFDPGVLFVSEEYHQRLRRAAGIADLNRPERVRRQAAEAAWLAEHLAHRAGVTDG